MINCNINCGNKSLYVFLEIQDKTNFVYVHVHTIFIQKLFQLILIKTKTVDYIIRKYDFTNGYQIEHKKLTFEMQLLKHNGTEKNIPVEHTTNSFHGISSGCLSA